MAHEESQTSNDPDPTGRGGSSLLKHKRAGSVDVFGGDLLTEPTFRVAVCSSAFGSLRGLWSQAGGSQKPQ